MNDLEEARQLFTDAGLLLPPVPRELQPQFRRIVDWCYASRDVDPMEMYLFGRYPAEAVAEVADDYVAVSHAGHGVNSYAINYHLVYGRIALFVQLGWGGVYMDRSEQAQKASDWFDNCAQVLKAAADFDPYDAAGRGRLVIVQSEFRGVNVCEWLSEPTGDPDTAAQWLMDNNRTEAPALELALDQFLHPADRRPRH